MPCAWATRHTSPHLVERQGVFAARTRSWWHGRRSWWHGTESLLHGRKALTPDAPIVGAVSERPAPRPLPERAADTTAEQPWPVRLLSMKIAEYVEKMSVLWVEGQVVQLTRRPGARTAYLTLRDPDVDMSLSVSVHVNALDAMPTALAQGARVVVQEKPVFWTQRGSLMLDARQIRPVGVGELLARIEHLKRTLASEGLFEPE